MNMDLPEAVDSPPPPIQQPSTRRGNRLDNWFSSVDLNMAEAPGLCSTSPAPEDPYIHGRGRSGWEPDWHQPRFEPSPEYEDVQARSRLRPPPLGGLSHKDKLGSVSESWGHPTEKVYGMFEIQEDPPSRSTSPFRDESAEMFEDKVDTKARNRQMVKETKEEFLEVARLGTGYEPAPWLVKREKRHRASTPPLSIDEVSDEANVKRSSSFREGQADQATMSFTATLSRPPSSSTLNSVRTQPGSTGGSSALDSDVHHWSSVIDEERQKTIRNELEELRKVLQSSGIGSRTSYP